MDFVDTLTIPKRAKLKFGESLDDVCGNGIFHAGLKDLFLKAYLSARQDDPADSFDKSQDEDEEDECNKTLRVLKSGADGQGSLSQRLALKARAEAGEWLLPAQTPPGAPVWLLRHFLGRLPQPLLQGSHWKTLGGALGELSSLDVAAPRLWELLERIAVSARALNQVEFEILALLALLLRNLSLKKQRGVEQELRDDTLNALGQYFIASIIARPFRPGLCTAIDKKCQLLLVFLAKYWCIIFQETPKVPIFNTPANKRATAPAELHECFRNHSLNSDVKGRKGCNKFIGFETLLTIQDNEESKQSSDNNIDTDCLRKRNATDDLNKRDLAPSRNNTIKKFPERDLCYKNPKAEVIAAEVEALNIELNKKFNTNNRIAMERIISHTNTAATLFNSKTKKVCENEERIENVDLKLDCSEDALFFNVVRGNLIRQFGNYKSTAKPNSADDEFFSVPNSEDSQ